MLSLILWASLWHSKRLNRLNSYYLLKILCSKFVLNERNMAHWWYLVMVEREKVFRKKTYIFNKKLTIQQKALQISRIFSIPSCGIMCRKANQNEQKRNERTGISARFAAKGIEKLVEKEGSRKKAIFSMATTTRRHDDQSGERELIVWNLLKTTPRPNWISWCEIKGNRFAPGCRSWRIQSQRYLSIVHCVWGFRVGILDGREDGTRDHCIAVRPGMDAALRLWLYVSPGGRSW